MIEPSWKSVIGCHGLLLQSCLCKRDTQRFLLSRTVACHAVRAINFLWGLVRAFVGEPPLVAGLHSPLKLTVGCRLYMVSVV